MPIGSLQIIGQSLTGLTWYKLYDGVNIHLHAYRVVFVHVQGKA